MVRQVLHSKTSYTKFTLATHKLKRMKASASLKNENWCMDPAYVDRLTNDNKGEKYRLGRQDRFDRTVDAKGMKTEDSKETVRAILTMITKKNQPIKNWVDKGKELAGEFKNYAKLKEYKLTLQ